MAVYLSIYGFFITLGMTLRQRESGPALLFTWIFLCWFMGMRYYVGCDFGAYLIRYKYLLNSFSGSIWHVFLEEEAGYQVITLGLKLSGAPYMMVILTFSIIIASCFVYFAARFKHSMMIIALMFPVLILQLGMSGIRQATAVGFLMLAGLAFRDKKRLQTAGWIIVGSLFHSSVILFLPMAIYAGRKINLLRLVIGLLLMSPVVLVLLGERADVYADRYINDTFGEIESGGAYIRYILNFIPALFFVLYHRKVEQAYPASYPLLLLFTILTFAILPIGLLNTVALHRLNYYVMPFQVVNFVFLSHVIFARKDAVIARLLPAVVYGFYSVSWFMTSRHADVCYTPYQNYLFLS